ncbi:MAG: T9SS type A sorting domain-containing protein [Sphingobacteriales bacterium]|jgi:hypothetical protein|nr:T9SS type A sorting domain-containing protein [Sphingobacteriales bacterium]MBP9140238.1 T9SS type A sorting domain-containing protein [Chitinophagales bacterium]MDA0197628.1 T9SS type A sorting domain-containing protein [Bacteroidota bacterium]MBK6889013.1 T9SS type A sorting domain-containing protein [Sphingobacteriales bacterium]MBK7528483.1 T9SS type A sorting domain-containing protein [Sphingobacteriales bacterium]
MYKNIALLLICFACFSVAAQAGQYLNLDFKHLFNDAKFELNTEYINNNGHNLKFTRLNYYLSGFTITHDGGQTTTLKDTYLLVTEKGGLQSLGEVEFTNIEGISFYVGVDKYANHGDPAQYPNKHPLSLKSPSMHWGWAAGYIFTALDGKSDTGDKSFNTNFEYHVVGDEFYSAVNITSKNAVKGINGVTVSVSVDVAQWVKDADFVANSIIHGGGPYIAAFMKNIINNPVFFETQGFNNIDNPLRDGEVKIGCVPGAYCANMVYTFANLPFISVYVYNISGQLVELQPKLPAQGQVTIANNLPSGRYFIKITDAANNQRAIHQSSVTLVK